VVIGPCYDMRRIDLFNFSFLDKINELSGAIRIYVKKWTSIRIYKLEFVPPINPHLFCTLGTCHVQTNIN